MDFLLSMAAKFWNNHRNLDQNRDALKRKLEELNGLKEDTKSRMITELQPRKKLKKEVQIFLDNVERINGEIQSLEGRIGERYFFTRGFHAGDVLKKIKEVDELIQHGKFHEGLVVDNPQWIGQVLSTTNLSGEAAKYYLEEIWKHLMDDKVQKIGVWGLGGVGKTSIIQLINNQLLKEKKFNTVVWITVSKEMSIAKLQKDIASKIRVTFSGDEDETARARMLFDSLSGMSAFVMILDDIWERVSLEKVGIPEPSTGSKLVLTTRSFDVCRQMGCSRAIKIEPLVKEEAWNLFLEKAGQDILNVPGLEPIARSIAERCGGLPLGIITVAACMKGIYDLSEWRNAQNELCLHIKSVNGLEDEVFRQLRFSYDHLKDLKLQRCFLSCALYPEDYRIREKKLVRLWLAEGLVEEMDSRRAEFDRGRATMNRLINSCLLEVVFEAEDQRYVKMHDLVRDMALRITSGTPRFLVKAGMGLTEPPDVQEWNEDLEKVSFMKNFDLQVLFPLYKAPPKCPMLTAFLLSCCGITSIPEGLFEHTHGLRILDLSQNPIENLPNSISNLKNLTLLKLRGCYLLEKVPSLSKLGALKELNLDGTSIEEVPHGMEKLLGLKVLSLSGTENVNEIPDGILSKLPCLQFLLVRDMFVKGEEFNGLKKLERFDGTFCDLQEFNMYVQAYLGREKPFKYTIGVRERYWEIEDSAGKTIDLHGCDIYTNEIMLPRDIKDLSIVECNLEDALFSRCFRVSLDTFSSLQILFIYRCKNMKKLFSPNCVPPNLKDLTVSLCFELEEIMASEHEGEDSGMDAAEFRLPQLSHFALRSLPELKSICSVNGVMLCGSLKQVEVEDCPKLTRMPLKLPQLDNVRPSLSPSPPLSLSIFIRPKEWWESVEWDHPDAKSVLEPFLTFRRSNLNKLN